MIADSAPTATPPNSPRKTKWQKPKRKNKVSRNLQARKNKCHGLTASDRTSSKKSESVSLNEKGKDFMKYILETETSASRWIDLRGYSIKELFGEYLNSYQAAQR